jgi:hypothetical protein
MLRVTFEMSADTSAGLHVTLSTKTVNSKHKLHFVHSAA